MERDVGYIGAVKPVSLCVLPAGEFTPSRKCENRCDFFFFWSVKTIRWHVIVFQSYFLARGSARSFCTRPSRKELALALIISPCSSGLYTYNISELERTSGRLVQTFVPIRRLRPSEGTSSADSPVGHKQVWNPGLPAAMLLPTRCSVVCEFSWSSASLECL